MSRREHEAVRRQSPQVLHSHLGNGDLPIDNNCRSERVSVGAEQACENERNHGDPPSDPTGCDASGGSCGRGRGGRGGPGGRLVTARGEKSLGGAQNLWFSRDMQFQPAGQLSSSVHAITHTNRSFGRCPM